MISDHLKNIFLEEFGYEPTPNQEDLFSKLGEFFTSRGQYEAFLLKGYAGTGKTSSISSVVKALKKMKIKSVLLAPTGRAAKVFSQYANQGAFTVHKKIYRQKSSSDGFGAFALDRNLHKDTFFIVDEASMISNESNENSAFGTGRLLDDLVEYVYSGNNCRLILIGDTAQLPPIGLDVSPALDADMLEVYDLQVTEVVLTQVVRQSEGSGILKNATMLRSLLSESMFFNDFPQFSLENEDVERISGEDLIDAISTSYDKHGLENVIVVNRSNKRANKYNEGIRNAILYKDSKISIGDFLMVVKNNYFWSETIKELDFIANGDIAEIVKIIDYQELYGFNFADIRIRLIDYDEIELDVKILLDTLDIESASLSMDDNKKLYYSVLEDYQDVKGKKQQYEKVRGNPYFNALQVKFSYAITCHKAQGGQWDVVFLDQGYITEEMLSREYLRWLYTAFTRSVDKLFLVNFTDKYFLDS